MLKHVGIQIPARGFIYYLFSEVRVFFAARRSIRLLFHSENLLLVFQNVELIYSQLRMIWF